MGLSAPTLPRAAAVGTSARITDWPVTLAVGLAIAAYVIGFSFLSLHRHSVYETDAFDLANMEQAVWNTTQGRPLDFTNFEGLTNRLGAHVEPILLPIALVYALRPGPETLLVLQTVVVALGALPVGWLARDLLGSRLATVVFPFIYLLFPALEAANLYDFHALTLTSTFIAFAFWFAHRSNSLGYWTAVVLALASKEDVPLLVIALGGWVAIGLKRPRLGIATSVIAVAWFVLAVMVVIPHFNPNRQSPYLDTRYGHLGANLQEIAGTLLFRPNYWLGYLSSPAKLAYLRDLLTPVAFLSVLSPLALAVLSPTLILILLSGSKLQNTLELEHYPAPLVPVVLVSAIYGAAWLSGQLARWTARDTASRWAAGLTLIALAATVWYHRGHGLTPLNADFELKQRTGRHVLADRLLPLVPQDASLSATGGLNAHLAARRTLYVYPKVADAEWVFTDLSPTIAPIVNRDRFQQIQELRRDGFGVVAAEDGYLMLARGRPDQVDPASAFRQPVAAGNPIANPLPAKFGDLTLAGYDVAFEGRATASLTLYMRAERTVSRDIRLFTVVLDDQGSPVPGSEAELVAPIWFPTSRWISGETYRIETKRWGRKDQPGDFGIGLVVTTSESPWDVGGRQTGRVEGGDVLARSVNGVLLLATLASDGRKVSDVTAHRLKTLPSGTRTLDVSLGNDLSLAGLSALPARCSGSCLVDFTLYWRSIGDAQTNLNVFVHVADREGRPLAQDDGPPDRGRRPVESWLPGEIIPDRHQLAVSGLPLGSYRILVGLYDPASGRRLAGPSGDAFEVGQIDVTP